MSAAIVPSVIFQPVPVFEKIRWIKIQRGEVSGEATLVWCGGEKSEKEWRISRGKISASLTFNLQLKSTSSPSFIYFINFDCEKKYFRLFCCRCEKKEIFCVPPLFVFYEAPSNWAAWVVLSNKEKLKIWQTVGWRRTDNKRMVVHLAKLYFLGCCINT